MNTDCIRGNSDWIAGKNTQSNGSESSIQTLEEGSGALWSLHLWTYSQLDWTT